MKPASDARAARRWIVAADDFAIDAGAVDGVLELITRGNVTATSALVDAPAWPGAASALSSAAAGRAALGLHLNLTQSFAGATAGAPVWPLAELILRCAAGAITRPVLRAAIERQLDAYEDALGGTPEYIDGHQHVHQLRGVRDELVAILLRRYPRATPWLRSTRRPPALGDFKARTIAALGDRQLRRLAGTAGLVTSDYLIGVYDFNPDAALYRRRLDNWLRQGPDGCVLMCHPARSVDRADPIGAARLMEYGVLSDPQFLAALRAAQITLERYPIASPALS